MNRDVAIKVSTAQFSERFEREAKAIAALNHPHICQLYDAGPNYLVMEFVAGSSLKGPMPVEKAVEYAGQILEALDAAHRQGITHRDLKPANILVKRFASHCGRLGGRRSRWIVWDLAPDGKRVAVLTPVESAEAPKQEHEVVLLFNFFDELRRRAPMSGK